MDDKLPLKRVWSGPVTHLILSGSPIISLEQLNLECSNLMYR